MVSTNPKQHRFRVPGLYLVTFQAIEEQTRVQVHEDGRVQVQTPLGYWHDVDPEALSESASASFKMD